MEESEARHPHTMTRTCPSCSSSRTTTVDSRPITAGGRRRRHHCHICSNRWTIFVDSDGRIIPTPPRQKQQTGRGRPSKRRRFTDDQVLLILTSPQRSLNDLTRELGTNHETVRLVRIGMTYLDVHPELPRQRSGPRETPEVSCLRCRNWDDGECRIGFPDPIEEGPEFAADCDHFSPRKEL
jgi:Predicted transcriptional regulator, consists of a Zn-ribbon and ATP-cone domains